MPSASSPDPADFLQTVAEDLEYLRTSWTGSIEDQTLRRDSAILRRFVVEGLLGRAWRAAGFDQTYTVIAPRLEYLVPDNRTDFAIAGGCNYGGVYAALATLRRGASSLALPEGVNPMAHSFALSEFGKSASIYCESTIITRHMVVQYVANKLGGVHFDSRRTRKRDRAFSVIDRNIERFAIPHSSDLKGKNTVYFELLSIGQLLVNSPDTARLVERICGLSGGAKQAGNA